MIPPLVSVDLRRLAALVSPAPDGFHIGSSLIQASTVDDEIAQVIYASWYLGVAANLDRNGSDPPVERGRLGQGLASLLRAAHAGSVRLEPGWVVLATAADGTCVVGRDTVERLVRPGDYANLSRPAAPMHPGEDVAVVSRVDSVDPASGYWVARSPAGEPDGPLGRLYLNVRPSTVASVLRRLTEHLIDEKRFHWSLKCPTSSEFYTRPDTIVCYVPMAAERQMRAIARAVLTEAGNLLSASTPPLTDQIGPGIAWADDPGNGDSFGMNRCRALVPGVANLAAGDYRRGGLAPLVAALEGAGIDPSAPWRNQLSTAPSR